MTAATETFRWFPGIPSRNFTTIARSGDVPVRVTYLTVLELVLVEEVDGQRLPVRTLAQVDLAGRTHDLATVETVIRDLGIVPS